jgi:hypothetical protein
LQVMLFLVATSLTPEIFVQKLAELFLFIRHF